MITVALYSLIGPAFRKIYQLRIHELGHVPSNSFFEVCAYHFEKIVGLLAYFIDTFRCFCYSDFHFHWRISFFGMFWSTPLYREKRFLFSIFYNFMQIIIHYQNIRSQLNTIRNQMRLDFNS